LRPKNDLNKLTQGAKAKIKLCLPRGDIDPTQAPARHAQQTLWD